jgi:transcriptional regulator with XRE-family HTH domain
MGNQEQETEHLTSQKIKLIRGFLRMNQTQFATAIGVSRMAVGLWESKATKQNGTKILPSEENFERIAALVNIDPFVIRTPDTGTEYLYNHLKNQSRPGVDCPLTDEELLKDIQEFKEAGLFKNLTVTAETIFPGDSRYIVKEDKNQEQDKSDKTVKANQVLVENILNDPDLTDEDKRNIIEHFDNVKLEEKKYQSLLNYNHSRKGVSDIKSDSWYFGDKKVPPGPIKIGGPPARSARKKGLLANATVKPVVKKWIEKFRKEWKDEVPPDYMNFVQKEIDQINELSNRANRGAVDGSIETKSGGFWVAVQYFVQKKKIENCHLFGKYFYDDYEHPYDLWLKKEKYLVKFCTLHKLNEIDLLKAEIERLVGSLSILESLIGSKQKKQIWVYDKESDEAGKFLDKKIPQWLTSLQKATGVDVVYVRDPELCAKLIIDMALPNKAKWAGNNPRTSQMQEK